AQAQWLSGHLRQGRVSRVAPQWRPAGLGMSADAETDPRGLPAIVGGDSTAGSPGGTGSPGEAGSPGAVGQGDGPPPPGAAGRLLGRLSVLPALLVMAWLLAGLPLLLADRFTP